jgi:hypothetical protein
MTLSDCFYYQRRFWKKEKKLGFATHRSDTTETSAVRSLIGPSWVVDWA